MKAVQKRMTNFSAAAAVPPSQVTTHDSLAGASRSGTSVWLEEFLTEHLADLIAFRRDIHQYPEVAFAENRTSAHILDYLQRWGITGELLPGGTGVVADLHTDRSSGPGIGLRADIDALPLQEESGLPFASATPGVAHACGHDIHTTVVLGALAALSRTPGASGRIRGIFQPAEEVMPGGAHHVVTAGVLHGIDRLYALHCDPSLPVGTVGLRTGAITSACDLIDVTVFGPGGHTSRPSPAADLVAALAAVIDQLDTAVAGSFTEADRPVLAWGAITAGQAANVLPRTGSLQGTLRLAERSGWDHAQATITAAIDTILGARGVRYELSYVRGVPPVVNDGAAVRDLNAAVLAAAGPEAVQQAPQSSGGEDFAIMLDHVPGALGRLGVWDGRSPQVDLHSPNFVADEQAIAVGIRTLVHAVLISLGTIEG